MDGIKKALKLIGIFLLAFMVIFLVIIWAAPEEVSVETSVNVNASVDTVWSYYTNTDLLDQWLTNFDSLAVVSGDPLTEGSELTLWMFNGERRSQMTETITKVEPPSTYHFTTSVPDVMRINNRVRFEPKPDGTTTITQNTHVKAEIWLIELYLFNANERMEEQFGQDLQKFKALVEKGG